MALLCISKFYKATVAVWVTVLLMTCGQADVANAGADDVLFTMKRSRALHCYPEPSQLAYIQVRESTWRSVQDCFSRYNRCHMKLIGIPSVEKNYLYYVSAVVNHEDKIQQQTRTGRIRPLCLLSKTIHESATVTCNNGIGTSITDAIGTDEQFQITWISYCEMEVCFDSSNITTESCDSMNQHRNHSSQCTKSEEAVSHSCDFRCHTVTTRICSTNTSSNSNSTIEVSSSRHVTLTVLLAVLLPLVAIIALALVAGVCFWQRKRKAALKHPSGRESSRDSVEKATIATEVDNSAKETNFSSSHISSSDMAQVYSTIDDLDSDETVAERVYENEETVVPPSYESQVSFREDTKRNGRGENGNAAIPLENNPGYIRDNVYEIQSEVIYENEKSITAMTLEKETRSNGQEGLNNAYQLLDDEKDVGLRGDANETTGGYYVEADELPLARTPRSISDRQGNEEYYNQLPF